MTCKHGDIVRYIGSTDRDYRVVHGREYTVFGNYPPIPMKGARMCDEVSIYVDDPHDDFGGVVSLPASHFQPCKAAEKTS